MNPPEDHNISKPYPFYLASALEGPVETLGDPSQWMPNASGDGIRRQVIIRKGKLFVWSRGKALVTDEYHQHQSLP